MDDILFEIALHSKIRTIINIMQVLPKLNTIYFWKLKCLKDYPTNTYLNCWTGPENYLIGKGMFFLNVYTNDKYIINGIDKYVYEYTPMFKKIKHQTEENYYDKLELVHIPHNKQQFVLIWDGPDKYTIHCYQSHEETIDAMRQMKTEKNAIVINLAHVSPCFITYGVLIGRPNINHDFFTF